MKIILIIAVCALAVAAHWPALAAKALSFDDQQYVTGNVLIQNPSWNSAERFLTEVFHPSTVMGYYQPLTMISLMLDSALGGSADNLVPFHRISLLLHAANVALVIILLYILLDNIWIATAIGLLFGLHPMTVENIPWISERKTLLAAFFAFWSLIFYVLFARSSNKISYTACFLMYLLALLSKPTSLPVPLMMLLMDCWPLKRFSRRTILEKLPFFVLAAIFAIIFFISQNRTAGISLPGQYEHRFLNAPLIILHNVIFYPAKMLWPVNLSSHYAYPQPFDFSNPFLQKYVVAAVILTGLLVLSFRWTAAILVGWLIFFIAILPTMQVLRFSDVIASDKFAYLPSIGLLMLLASFLIWICKNSLTRTVIIAAVVVSLAVPEAVATRKYLAYWRDSITLNKHMLSLAPDAAPLYGNLGIAYGRLGKYDESFDALNMAIKLRPDDGIAFYNLGVTYLNTSCYDKAVAAFKKAIELAPGYYPAWCNLGFVYGALGRFGDEIDACEKALEINPDYFDAYMNLGFARANLGRFPEAVKAYGRAAVLLPRNTDAHFGLGLTLLRNNEPNSARGQYEILKTLDPNSAVKLLDSIRK